MNISTDRFWELMCSPSFIRVDAHTGKHLGQTYSVIDPPESVDGFIEYKTACIVDCLIGKSLFSVLVGMVKKAYK